MRATWLPWYDEATEGRGLIHTGVAYSHRDAFDNQFDREVSARIAPGLGKQTDA